MTSLIHGANGAQGGPVAAVLRASGTTVHAAVRDAAAYRGDHHPVQVDLASADSLEQAYRGVDGVFVHLPVGAPDVQLAHAHAIVAAVAAARPGRVVVSTSGYATTAGTPVGELVEGIERTGVSLAVVAPRLFLENLLLPTVVAPVRADGVLRYPIRADYRVSWASHLDVADVVARLLTDHAVTGVVGVGALPGLLGTDLAAGFAAHLRHDVTFEPQDVDAFGASIEPMFGAEGAAPVVDSYRWRAEQPDELVDEATSAQRLLGLEPRTVEAWLGDLGV
ncbi:SDR family oxidoreductase [Agrococcus versicolor]